FVERLDALFTTGSATTGRELPDITGLIGQYAHGNEPSHHVAWLYHYAGRPDRSAERVRYILDTMYRGQPDGLPGNEHCGQMSAGSLLPGMGFYPVCPGPAEYLRAPPLFDRITLRPDGGKPFTIGATGAGPRGRYITAATLNGKPLTRSFLHHAEIAAGG